MWVRRREQIGEQKGDKRGQDNKGRRQSRGQRWGSNESRRKIVDRAHLENLHLLQDQLLRLQVISGQNDDFLNCSLVCGPQHTPVSHVPATSHPCACQQPLGFPFYSLSGLQQGLILVSTGSTVLLNLCYAASPQFNLYSMTWRSVPLSVLAATTMTNLFCHPPLHRSILTLTYSSGYHKTLPGLPWHVSFLWAGYLRFIMTHWDPARGWMASSDSGWKDIHSSAVAAIAHKPISLLPVTHTWTKTASYATCEGCMLCCGRHTEALLKADKQIISLTPVGKIKVMDMRTVPLLLFPFIPPVSLLSLLLLIHPCPPGTNLVLFTSCEWSEAQTLWLVKFPLEHKRQECFSLNDKWLQGRQALHLHGIYFHGGILSSIIQLPTDTVIPHSKGSWDLTDFVLKITLKRHFVVLETKFELRILMITILMR